MVSGGWGKEGPGGDVWGGLSYAEEVRSRQSTATSAAGRCQGLPPHPVYRALALEAAARAHAVPPLSAHDGPTPPPDNGSSSDESPSGPFSTVASSHATATSGRASMRSATASCTNPVVGRSSIPPHAVSVSRRRPTKPPICATPSAKSPSHAHTARCVKAGACTASTSIDAADTWWTNAALTRTSSTTRGRRTPSTTDTHAAAMRKHRRADPTSPQGAVGRASCAAAAAAAAGGRASKICSAAGRGWIRAPPRRPPRGRRRRPSRR